MQLPLTYHVDISLAYQELEICFFDTLHMVVLNAVCYIYKPPSLDNMQQLLECINIIHYNVDYHCLMSGDFN